MIEILKPLYFGNDPKNRKIGIAEFRLRNEPMVVEILIKHRRSQKHGEGYIYPGKYYMSKLEIAKYPLEEVQTKYGKIPMYIVPIVDLKPVESFKGSNNKSELMTAELPEFIIKQGSLF